MESTKEITRIKKSDMVYLSKYIKVKGGKYGM
jgi:hypothetical protein